MCKRLHNEGFSALQAIEKLIVDARKAIVIHYLLSKKIEEIENKQIVRRNYELLFKRFPNNELNNEPNVCKPIEEVIKDLTNNLLTASQKLNLVHKIVQSEPGI